MITFTGVYIYIQSTSIYENIFFWGGNFTDFYSLEFYLVNIAPSHLILQMFNIKTLLEL